MRAEYWDDQNNFWVAAFTSPNGFIDFQETANPNTTFSAPKATPYTEFTWGMNIKPFSKSKAKWLSTALIRPEVRWDHSYNTNAFDNFRDDNQVTIASDFIVTFQ